MGLPAKRRTKQSKRERASHFALKKFALSTCSHCTRKIRPHTVCPHCGYYKGRQILEVTSRIEKRAKKSKAARGDKDKQETSETKK